jgi:dTDP-4-dehydrorhamnose 3,5-epimerase
VELTEDNKKQLLVPRWFAHGFIVSSKEAIFSYKVDNYYSPENDRGVDFDDELLGINWKLPLEKLQLSKKDKNQIRFKDSEFMEYKVDLYK